MEPRIRYETPAPQQPAEPRSVRVVLPLDWAQAVTRLQQLHNAGYEHVRLYEDDQGRIRIAPELISMI
jgi:hypothetical protein